MFFMYFFFNFMYVEFKETGMVFQDSRTKEILAHNHAMFFNQARVRELFQQQVVQPITEFVESQ